MIHRVFSVEPGYDCRAECQHERRGDHGICSDIWTYAVVDRDARAALEFQLSTPFHPATVDVSSLSDFSRKFGGRNVAMHFGYPTSKEQVLGRPTSTNCAYVGTCYDAGTWGLMADELAAHFDQAQGLEGVGDPLTRQPALWAALEDKLAALVTQRRADRLSDGDLRWRVCEHCGGAGVVDTSGER